jgi:hypothetical protein
VASLVVPASDMEHGGGGAASAGDLDYDGMAALPPSPAPSKEHDGGDSRAGEWPTTTTARQLLYPPHLARSNGAWRRGAQSGQWQRQPGQGSSCDPRNRTRPWQGAGQQGVTELNQRRQGSSCDPHVSTQEGACQRGAYRQGRGWHVLHASVASRRAPRS